MSSKMEIQLLSKNDIAKFKSLLALFNQEFETPDRLSDESYVSNLLAQNYFYVFVITSHEEVVGGLTLYSLDHYYNNKPLAFIYDVAITKKYQGQGLGKRLLAETCKFCKEKGFYQAFVEAEADDTLAVEFYKKTGISEEINVKQFTYKF